MAFKKQQKGMLEALEAYHRSLSIGKDKEKYFDETNNIPQDQRVRYQASWNNTEAFFESKGRSDFTDTIYFDDGKKGIEGVVGIFKNKVAISFLASNSEYDWKINLDWPKKEVPYAGMGRSKIRVHSGYMSHYRDMRLKILELVTNLVAATGINKVLITGHSLGGAIAQLFALDLDYNYGEALNLSVEGFSFGSPRLGNGAFRESFNKRMSKRFTNVHYGNEFTSKYPFWFFGFRHIGASADKTKYNLRHPNIFFWFSIKDHYFWNYVNGWLHQSKEDFDPPVEFK